MASLRVVDGRSRDYVRVPRFAAVEAAMEAQAIGDELDRELQTVYALIWANRRTKALLLISDLRLSIGTVRRQFNDLAGIVEGLPTDPEPEMAAPERAA